MSDVLMTVDAAAGQTGPALAMIATYLEQALEIADSLGDKLLGAKLSECLEHVKQFAA